MDLAESTNSAYSFSHIAQVLDFAKFKNKIDNSLYYHMTQISSVYIELIKKLQDGIFKFNTEFIHRDITSFTLTIDTNVLNDYLIIGQKTGDAKSFGRWSELKFFDFERFAAAFLFEFNTDTEKSNLSLYKLQEIYEGFLVTDKFYSEAYGLVLTFIKFLQILKQNPNENAKNAMTQALESLNLIRNSIKEISTFSKFLAQELFEYNDFVNDLKKICFFVNTVCVLLFYILGYAKGLIPEQKKTKKSKKTQDFGLAEIFKNIVTSVFSIFDQILAIVSNEDFLVFLQQDSKITQEASEIKSLVKLERTEEIIQARKLLVKEICTEIHAIRASGLILLNK